MSSRIISALLAAALAFTTSAAAQEPTNSFVVTDVRVFDGETVTPRANVVIREGRIAEIGPAGPPPAGLSRVDGKGRTLLPGLIDSHTHTVGAVQKDALRFGVTTELDMFMHPAALASMRAQRDSLDRVGQSDLWSAGVLATAPGGHGTEYGITIPTLTSPAEADAWVRARIAEGSDYIKIVYEPGAGRPSLDGPTLSALIRAAHSAGKLAVVHVSTAEASLAALRAGADGLAHSFRDEEAPGEFYSLAAERRAFVIPTLVVVAGIAGRDDGPRLAADRRIRPFLSNEQNLSLKMPGRREGARYEVAAGQVKALRAAGVDVLAGTDAGNPATAHGASLHAEMALLVQAGLTPVEALRAATSVPARRFGLQDRGLIRVGARADLIMVEGDPTRDISRTRAIVAVWKNGYPVERPRSTAGVSKAGASLSGILGDFETGLQGPLGSTWQWTTDKFVGGTSEATVARVAPGVLRAEGVVRPSPFSWAGAQVMFSGFEGPGRDLSGSKQLVFRIRGDHPDGVVMLFDTGGPFPKTYPISIKPDWQEVRVRLSAFKDAKLKSVVGLGVTTDAQPGAFAFELDDVRLE